MIVILVFFILLTIGLPIYFVLGLSALTYFVTVDMPFWTILQRQFVGLNSFVMLAVPLFLLAGNLMAAGGTLKRLVRFSLVLVGRFKGGVAYVNVLASMFFAGITGNAVADVAALGPIEIEMMTAQGYKKEYSAAVTVASATIGPIIPPSVPAIMYGLVSGASIGALFAAGVIPGILIGVVLMIQIYFTAKKNNFPTSESFPLGTLIREFIIAIPPLLMPAIILIGIYTGFFTPTEAAGVACLYAFILGKFVYNELKWTDIPKILRDTGRMLGSASTMFAIASAFTYIVSLENIPATLSTILLGMTDNKFLLLLLINIALLIIGCFMEGISAILITTPLLLPAVTALGVSPIHFGIVMIINLTIGLLTPPLGLSVFVVSTITKLPSALVFKNVVPMLIVLIALLLVLTYVPILTMWLPNLMFK